MFCTSGCHSGGSVGSTNSASRADTRLAWVAWPLGKLEKPGTSMAGWMRGDSSLGRGWLKASLACWITNDEAITSAVINSSVRGVRRGLMGSMAAQKPGLKLRWARISGMRSGRWRFQLSTSASSS